MVGSFVDWRGGREMPRWWKLVAVVSASGVCLRRIRVEWCTVMLSGKVEREVVLEELVGGDSFKLLIYLR